MKMGMRGIVFTFRHSIQQVLNQRLRRGLGICLPQLGWIGGVMALTMGVQGQPPDTKDLAASATVFVGNRTIVIPAPIGFVRCDGLNSIWDMATLSMQGPDNRILASFGTDEDYKAIAEGKGASYARNFNVQSIRSVENREIGERTFAELRSEIKKGVEEMATALEKELAKLTESGNQKLSKDFGVNPGLRFTDTAVLGVFEDTATSLGFTMAMHLQGELKSDQHNKVSRSVVAALMTTVNGRLICLYSTAPYAGKADQQLTEASLMAWRDAVVAANPRVEGPSAGFDWNSVTRAGVIGGVAGGLIGLFGFLRRKLRPKISPVCPP